MCVQEEMEQEYKQSDLSSLCVWQRAISSSLIMFKEIRCSQVSRLTVALTEKPGPEHVVYTIISAKIERQRSWCIIHEGFVLNLHYALYPLLCVLNIFLETKNFNFPFSPTNFCFPDKQYKYIKLYVIMRRVEGQ